MAEGKAREGIESLTGSTSASTATPRVTLLSEWVPGVVYRPHTVVSAQLVNGLLEIVRRYPSNMSYANGERIPDSLEKEIYVCKDGMIVLDCIIKGNVVPEQRIPEKFVFAGNDKTGAV